VFPFDFQLESPCPASRGNSAFRKEVILPPALIEYPIDQS
jgi:hypothetical protein